MKCKKYIVFLLFSLIVPSLSYADSDTAVKADSLFNLREYPQALEQYMKPQSEQESLTVNQLFRMGVAMTEGTTNQQQAINLLSKLTEFPIAPSETWYYLGEANRRMYKFEDAIDYFNIYLNRAKDDSELITQAELQINSCENGLQMLDYATRINRIAKKAIPATEFYSVYDTFGDVYLAKKPQAMWMSADSLVENRHPLSDLVFFPEKNKRRDANIIYFSSYGQDKETGLDIFCIKRIEGDSWGEPEEIAAVNSPFDEISPYLTPDGNTLYFASNGHYGMGGFDIYKSEYNNATRGWTIPENLGFPISSPYDDFLFVPDATNRTACFASSRDTNNDELTVYKVEMSVTPERISLNDVNEIMAMASFNVDFSQNSPTASTQKVEVPIKELAGNESYVLLVKSAAALSEQLSNQLASLNKLRQDFSFAPASEKNELEQKIIIGEQEVQFTQATFAQVQALLSNAEYQFYTNGTQPSISEDFKAILKKNLSEEPSKPTTSNAQVANFGEKAIRLQNAPNMTMKLPKLSDADKYRFRTTGKSIILLNDPVPKEGIVYKIRIGIFSKTLSEEQLKNLSPVTTEERGSTARYYVGVFRTYNDALKALGEVKKKGFKDAAIDAWVNGKSETTSRARNVEKQQKTKRSTSSSIKAKPDSKSTVYRINVAVLGSSPGNISTLLSSLSEGRDIVRKVNPDGSTTYSVGIYTKQAEAEDVRNKLIAEGVVNVEVVGIEVNN
ncbi:MAG: hypothetical protein LBG19_06965 [Prevotellaceae bacterium]|jgi:tetratricopeptide (TPR) repeat protein|nr:hypothetical protein [Prevotellaceae bacterium]